jgi:hypothetical protein
MKADVEVVHIFGIHGIEASVVDATNVNVNKVQCEAFSDCKGKKPLGKFNIKQAANFSHNFQPVTVQSFKCTA